MNIKVHLNGLMSMHDCNLCEVLIYSSNVSWSGAAENTQLISLDVEIPKKGNIILKLPKHLFFFLL